MQAVPFAGSSSGSTGTLMKEDRVNIDVTITSPGALIEAGSEFTATLVVGSRVSDDTWEIDVPLIVEGYDKIDITMNSESSDYENKLGLST